MFKFLTIFFASISLSPLWGSEQLIVVISSDMNSTNAIMQRYEKDSRWEKIGGAVLVTLGRSGLGWAEGSEPLKNEGDGRSPAGLFRISGTFGYDEHPNSAMKYLHADDQLICVDDVSDSRYNQIVSAATLELPQSYERMYRDDEVYRNGAVIDYNAVGAKGRGSCIFIHLNHPDNRPTSGCTAMDEKPLKELLAWLDPRKKPMILQIPRSACERYQIEFAGIECQQVQSGEIPIVKE